ncbi:MAG: hypothetical protein IKM97_05855 [Clostridia bacterium]|nr:hypothetical protein [Clostridia bacterium]
MCSILANIVVAIQFFLLNALTGAIQETSQLISAIISLYRGKKEKNKE